MPRDKCPQKSCGSLEVQVVANLNSIHSLNEASRGEEQGFVISRRWLWVPASSAGLGSSSHPKWQLQSQPQPEPPLCMGRLSKTSG